MVKFIKKNFSEIKLYKIKRVKHAQDRPISIKVYIIYNIYLTNDIFVTKTFMLGLKSKYMRAKKFLFIYKYFL